MFKLLTVSLLVATHGIAMQAISAPAVDQKYWVNTEWLRRALDGIQSAEYNFFPVDENTWAAPNRAHNVRISINNCGVEIARRKQQGGESWRIQLALTAIGREGMLRNVRLGYLTANANRIENHREDIELTEWYENNPDGLKQGFTIGQRPVGLGPLLLALSYAEGLSTVLSADGASVIFQREESGNSILQYGGLYVFDSDDREIHSSFMLSSNQIMITIDDDEAKYPLTVDPILSSPDWTFDGGQNDAELQSVATAGDINGDGYSDVIIGFKHYDNTDNDEGRAAVFHGSATGLSTSPDWTAESNQAGALFGYTVATAGDVNGDGYDDVIIGAVGYNNTESDEGAAFVYYGSSSGLGENGTPSNADWFAESNQANALFGHTVAAAGDVNGDGYGDVIISAFSYDNGQIGEGSVFVWFGGASGLGANGTPSNADWSAESNQANAAFGVSVATAGDVNADGYDDIIVGAYLYNNPTTDEGVAFVWLGSSSGLGDTGTPTNADWSSESNQASAQFGWRVATAGDVNGDGYSDVIVGAFDYTNGQNQEGRAFVYHGSSVGPSTSANWTAESDQSPARLGWSVGTAGDVNGDGYADIIVGAYNYNNGQTEEGAAFAWFGSAYGLGANGTPSNADWSEESDQAGAFYGWSVATGGDVNGDGYSDVIIGAELYNGSYTDEGRAYVYYGLPDGLANTSAWTFDTDQAYAEITSIAAAGDVNGDGFGDVIVGSYKYDAGSSDEGRAFVFHGNATGLSATPDWTAESNQASALFGRSVSSAGDVNGDGYSDVIIGSPHYTNGQTNEGKAFIWYGSSTGLGASGTPTNADWSAEGNQDYCTFGWSVAGAGDVNGDGYLDVIVGARLYTNGESDEGRAFVFHGSTSGPSTSANWTAESNQATAHFGYSVAGAGDVNRDGFSDVIIGAPDFDNGQSDEGRAYVFHGSSTGLSSSADWTAESDQASSVFGGIVATAGDVNGDGYSDVIVGAQYYDNGQTNEGRAFLFRGSSTGLASSANWTAESDQVGAEFGGYVSSAGDVNMDGCSDVIIAATAYDNGSTDEGKVFIWLGNPTGSGTPSNADWSYESNQADAWLGAGGVATAGDVNGDGFSDVIVASPFFDDGQTDEGQAFLFYGNGGDGLDRSPRQARYASTTPVDVLGNSENTTQVRLRTFARTPIGRGKAKLEWEVKQFGTAFSGTGTSKSASWTDTGTPGTGGSGVTLNADVSGLTAATSYKWRVRILTTSPLFPHSPWFRLAQNALNEKDFRTKNSSGGGGGELDKPIAAVVGFALDPSWPNPFNPSTVIRYEIPRAGQVDLRVLDVRGRDMAILVNAVQEGGKHTVTWNAQGGPNPDLPSGIYILRLGFEELVKTQRLILLK